jgi:hypothetical protein
MGNAVSWYLTIEHKVFKTKDSLLILLCLAHACQGFVKSKLKPIHSVVGLAGDAI